MTEDHYKLIIHMLLPYARNWIEARDESWRRKGCVPMPNWPEQDLLETADQAASGMSPTVTMPSAEELREPITGKTETLLKQSLEKQEELYNRVVEANRFYEMVRGMRKAQRQYFKTRSKADLLAALNAEAAVDEALDPPAITTPDPDAPIQGELL